MTEKFGLLGHLALQRDILQNQQIFESYAELSETAIQTPSSVTFAVIHFLVLIRLLGVEECFLLLLLCS